MKILLLIIAFICSLFGFGPKQPETAKSWAYQDPDTGIIYSQEHPEGVESDLGPAICYDPVTGEYVTSDGNSWKAD
ncbi:hypothetical protein J6X13_02025 [Candidatus Saccharibacteria bacterium]|nr:hypothetical protein [Candidatus Saccharibacteria bacterium]